MDRFDIILDIFSLRSKTNLARFQLSYAYLENMKAQIGREGGFHHSWLSSASRTKLLKYKWSFISFAEFEKFETVSARTRGGIGQMGGMGEKENTTQKNEIQLIQKNLRQKIDIEKQKHQSYLRRFQKGGVTGSDPTVALVKYIWLDWIY